MFGLYKLCKYTNFNYIMTVQADKVSNEHYFWQR